MSKAIVLLSTALVAIGCESTPPTFEDVAPAEELWAEGQKTLEGQRVLLVIPHVDYDAAIETFQAIIDNYPYSEYAIEAELAIADAYFDDGRYEEALSYYRDFVDLHPKNEKVAYALYRAGLAHAERSHPPNRDQTATIDALQFLDRLLAEHPHSPYADEGEILWRELRTRLARQVDEIGDFYMARGEWESAAERYRSLLNEFPGLGLDARALYKLGLSYAKMNRREEAESIFQAVVQNYADSEVAKDAADRIATMN